MRVILNLPEENLNKLEEIAKKSMRSRKNFMEKILIDFSTAKNGNESQKFDNTDSKNDFTEETMPEGLNWKERIEWTHNYKQKLKNLKK